MSVSFKSIGSRGKRGSGVRGAAGAAALALSAGLACAQTATMPAHVSNFTGNTRGYWFTSPGNFRIMGIQSLQAPAGPNGFMNWAVVRFTGAVPPPVFALTTNAFTQLGLGLDQTSGGYTPVSIDVNTGDVIGVYGNTATAAGTATGVNSYTAAGVPATTTIMGNVVALARSGMQFHLGSATSPAGMHDVWAEPASTQISRVEFTYLPSNTIWSETGDAGQRVGTAQSVFGTGSALNLIEGTLAGSSGADMYRINVCNPAGFSAGTGGGVGTVADTQLFMFDLSGHGVTANDDDPGGGVRSLIGSTIIGTRAAQNYFLAISSYNNDPVDGGNQVLWNNTPFNTERAPDGPGAANALDHWTGSGETGTYQIALTGACFATPSIWIENGDAGHTVDRAQDVVGDGPLDGINGEIVSSTRADMYRLKICNPANFSATTAGGSGTLGDTQLFLFDTNGRGITFNDDSVGLRSTLTSTFVASRPEGNYYLAVSSFDLDPVDIGGLALWIDTPFAVERVPDGPGAANAVRAWDGTGLTGTYEIKLTGTCYVAPCPPTTAAIGGPSSGWPSTHGVQNTRLFRDGISDTCALAAPGGAPFAGAYAYDKYDYINTSATAVCVQFDISTTCAATNRIYAAAYIGPFIPAVPTTNNVASAGSSPLIGAPSGMSFVVPANTAFSVVVSEVDAGAGCGNYTFRLSGGVMNCNPKFACYPNCDESTTAPCLNVGDFGCFLNAFAAGDPYANCDGSTTVPVLNVGDFGCFLNAFAAGCGTAC